MKTEHIFVVVFGLVAANLLFKVAKNRGFRGALFGAPIRRTIAELELEHGGLVSTKVRIHQLDTSRGGGAPDIGIEVVHKTFASWEMTPVSLSREEARSLAAALVAAADQTSNVGAG
jgi:hypothetical protein